MSDGYVPPFQVTEEITNLTIEIGQYACIRIRCCGERTGFVLFTLPLRLSRIH